MDIEELVVEHAGWIRRTARRYYDNEQDADDLASETIYKCLNQGRRFDRSRNFKPWALTIMENTYITQYNRRRCVMFTGLDAYDPYSGSEAADQRASVKQMLSVIRKCARKSVSIECVLLYAKGYCYDEIADIVGIHVGTVKSRVAAGRRMLHDALD
ncbi:MAG: sigma-70 family RNA polymerase sigma factor [Muribaculaceae bacterium]|nr:sigma-70 family RNA polymerase sigma factor [Muribaculaceae bacterium]